MSRQDYGRGCDHRPRDNVPRPTECLVCTNHTHLEVIDASSPSASAFDLVCYEVAIHRALRRAAGEGDRPSAELVPGAALRLRLPDLDPWRIVQALIRRERFVLSYDGAARAVAPSHRGAPRGEQTYEVVAKTGCAPDNPDAEMIKDRHFFVTLKETHTIPFNDVAAACSRGGDEAVKSTLNLLLTSTALQSGMDRFSSKLLFPLQHQKMMYSCQQGSFDWQRQERGRGRGRGRGGGGRQMTGGIPEAANETKHLLQGMTQRVVFSDGGGVAQVLTDSVTEWVDKEYRDQRLPLPGRNPNKSSVAGFDTQGQNLRRIPLLETTSKGMCVIAGVNVGNLRNPVDNVEVQKKVEDAVFLLRLNVCYDIPVNKEREQEMRDRGDPEKTIVARRVSIRKDREMRTDLDDGSSGYGKRIIWAADDPNEFAFERKGQQTTVARYFRDRYGIHLRYANAPMVFLGKGVGWIPIEFVFQGPKKTRRANDEDMVREVLNHYDRIPGNRLLQDITDKRLLLSNAMGAAERLAAYNLRISTDSAPLKTKVLSQPKVKFGYKFGRNIVKNPQNGSFDLRDIRFPRPATLSSFAVIDVNGDTALCKDYITKLLAKSEEHGLEIPTAVRKIPLEKITFTHDGSYEDAVDFFPKIANETLRIAKDVFVNDSTDTFRKNETWFKTQCITDEGKVDCIVLPPQKNGDKAGLLLSDKARSLVCSHRITTYSGKTSNARLMVKIGERDKPERDELIDPLHLRFQNGHFQAIRRVSWEGQKREEWTNVEFRCYCFCLCDDEAKPEIEKDKVESFEYLHLAEDFEIDCPSLILVFLPNGQTALHERIKYETNIHGGYQTQCAVAPKFKMHRNKDMLLSSICHKINTKLSSHSDKDFVKPVSWLTEGTSGIDALDWVCEKPTLVLGIGLASGMGYSSETVVSASTLLDSTGLPKHNSSFVQQKSDGIAHHIMKAIMEESLNAYYEQNNFTLPERVLIYRDSMSDGNFSQADNEIDSIRAILKEDDLKLPITYIVCQNQHNVRLVPATNKNGVRGNVYSGTVLDHTVMQMGTKMTGLSIDEEEKYNISSSRHIKMELFSHVDNSSDDFFLTAQQGLKGTSKPIYYRVRLNENKVWGPIGATPLTKTNLQNCTYQMCFMYGSATKATREVPIIKNAKKLSNQVLSGLKYLRNGDQRDGKTHRLKITDGTDGEKLYFIEVTDEDGRIVKQKHNFVYKPFRNHLAA